jgi:hypothetical protein
MLELASLSELPFAMTVEQSKWGRVHLSCGEGVVDVFATETTGYRRLATIASPASRSASGSSAETKSSLAHGPRFDHLRLIV